MSAPTNQWKLGAFVLGSVLVGLAAVAVTAARTLQIDTVTYTSYFDEAVTGLDPGSPVSFRGVKIGTISAIDVAPDRRHVEISYALSVAVLERLGLTGVRRGRQTTFSIPPGLRVQIASTGLTGIKYLQIDFFDAEVAPPPRLPFPVPENYIPATPSTMKNLEAAVVRAVDQLPVLAQELATVVAKVNVILDEVGSRGLPAKAVATLDGTNRLLASMEQKLSQLPVADLSRGTAAVLTRLERVLDQLEGQQGLLASMSRTSEALGDVAGPELGANLDDTGRDLREAAVAVRQLVEALQRDPDMLLKGKGPASP